MSAGFDEVQFPPSIALKPVGGPGFSTDVVADAAGYLYRNQNWSEALRSFEIAEPYKLRPDMDPVVAFFHARNGRARGFRFKDWSDYKAAHVLTYGMQGVMQNTVTGGATGDGSTTVFQLQKAYSSGGVSHLRTIAKPVTGSVVAYVNGVSVTFTLDTTTGLLTFSAPPGNGTVPTWDGQFDVPVIFGVDKLEITVELKDANADPISFISKLPITEIRV